MADSHRMGRRGFLSLGASTAASSAVTPTGMPTKQIEVILRNANNSLDLTGIISRVTGMANLEDATMHPADMNDDIGGSDYAVKTLEVLSDTLSGVDLEALESALKALPNDIDPSFLRELMPLIRHFDDDENKPPHVSIDQYLEWVKTCHMEAKKLLAAKDEIIAKHNAFATLYQKFANYSLFDNRDYYRVIEGRFRAGELSLQEIADPENHERLAREAWQEVELDWARTPRINKGNKVYMGRKPAIKPEIEAEWKRMVPPEKKVEYKTHLKLGGPFKDMPFYTRLFSDEYYLPVNAASPEVENAMLALLAVAGNNKTSTAKKPLFQQSLLGVPSSHYLVLQKGQLEALQASNQVWSFLERCNHPDAATYTKELQQLIPCISGFLGQHHRVLPEGELPHRQDVEHMSFQEMTARCGGNPPVLPHQDFSTRVGNRPASSLHLS